MVCQPARPFRGCRTWAGLTFAMGTAGIFLISRVPDWLATMQGAVRRALPVLAFSSASVRSFR